ncbi:MAG TPA: PQQ-binding-like beta-propeller repeat protein [Acidimicrobiales bacterium]|nr:PQQ-binding-like beta-propeller repeat protein [Acidimicrobiales bacterium]
MSRLGRSTFGVSVAAATFLVAELVPLGLQATAGTGAAAQSAQTEWPSYGADLSNSRTVAGGPAATKVPLLVQAWRDDFTDGDFTGTPVVAGGIAYVGSNGGIVRAIQAVGGGARAAGSVLWSTSVAPDGINGSLAVSGATVYVPVAKVGGPYLVALDAGTGQRLWSTALDTSTDADVYGSPTVAPAPDGRLLVLEGVSAVSGDPASPLRGSVIALDAATGALVWKQYTVPPGLNGGAVWSTPSVDLATGAVYVGTGNAYSGQAAPTTDAMLELDLATGAIRGFFQATRGDVFSSSTPGLDFDFGASPNLIDVGGRHLVGEGQKSGAYWVLDRTTMQPVWHAQLGPGSVVGGVIGSTAYDSAANQIAGPITAPGYVWSVQASTGTPRWVSPGLADPVHFSPVAISSGVVYSLLSGGFIGAWSEQTGLPLAQLSLSKPGSITPEISFGGVSVADGLVIANTGTQGSNGSIVAFRTPAA